MGGIVDSIFGGGGGSSAPAAPAQPNYTQAAQATAAGNMIGQNTPYGTLNYTQSGTDAYGNPMYTANQTVAPSLQPAVQNSQNVVGNYQYSPFSAGNLPSYGINPGQDYQSAEMQILQPQIDRQRQQTVTQLANQGIQPGSEAYKNAMMDLNNQQNNLLANVTTQGIGVGLNANQQQYGQNLNTYNTNATTPFTQANAIKGLATPSYVQTPSGPNYLQAAQNQYAGQLGAYNAAQANQTNQMNGLLGLGGTLGSAGIQSGAFNGLGSYISNLF